MSKLSWKVLLLVVSAVVLMGASYRAKKQTGIKQSIAQSQTYGTGLAATEEAHRIITHDAQAINLLTYYFNERTRLQKIKVGKVPVGLWTVEGSAEFTDRRTLKSQVRPYRFVVLYDSFSGWHPRILEINARKVFDYGSVPR